MSEEQKFVRSAEIDEAIRQLVDEIHDLLDGPTGRGQWDGDWETQKVVLTLPRAFVELAAFLAVVDESDPASLGFWEYVKMTPDDGMAVRHLNRMRNRFLERRIDEAMHLTLHLLATEALELRGKRGL